MDSTAKEGRLLSAWLVGQGINNLVLLYNPKGLTSFHSGHWNSSTNPDLAFASADLYSRLPDRPVLEKFPKSQHRPSLITPPRLALSLPSIPVKRWNFRKATWSQYRALTNNFAKALLPPDSADVDQVNQDFCNINTSGAKRSIPRVR